jgi:hypothetical protein
MRNIQKLQKRTPMNSHLFLAIIKRIFFVFLLVFHNISYCDIVAGTTILTPSCLVPVEEINVGDYVLGYENNVLVENEVTNISLAEVDIVFSIETDQGVIQATKNQLFYDPRIKQWVRAKKLTTNNTFFDSHLNYCSCQNITLLLQKTTIYKISTKSPHNFFISDARVLTHNNFFAIALRWAFGGGIEFVGATLGALFGGTAIGVKVYNKYKKNQVSFDLKAEVDSYSGGCFSDPYCNDQNISGGCFIPDNTIPKVIPCYRISDVIRDNDIGCTIVVEQQESPVGCIFPKEETNATILCLENTQKGFEGEAKRYGGPKYYRTEDWIEEHPFGQEIQKSLERARYINQGKRAFKLTNNIHGCDGFKKGDYVVVDAMHYDHLEVFDKHQSWSHVANFDGTINYEKTKQGQKDKRQPLQKG